MKDFWNWIKARAVEPSTWLGIGAATTAIGTALQGGVFTWQTILAAVVGTLAALKSDPGSTS
jgi:hypothetical protein